MGSCIKLEFCSVGFCGGRKTGEPREKPSEQGQEPIQIQPRYYMHDARYVNQTEALTTVPTLLPQKDRVAEKKINQTNDIFYF